MVRKWTLFYLICLTILALAAAQGGPKCSSTGEEPLRLGESAHCT